MPFLRGGCLCKLGLSKSFEIAPGAQRLKILLTTITQNAGFISLSTQLLEKTLVNDADCRQEGEVLLWQVNTVASFRHN